MVELPRRWLRGVRFRSEFGVDHTPVLGGRRLCMIRPMMDFLQTVKKRVVVYDGAMGTNIQSRNPTLDDYWGKENCSEVLVLSRPDIIRDIHADFFKVGCDMGRRLRPRRRSCLRVRNIQSICICTGLAWRRRRRWRKLHHKTMREELGIAGEDAPAIRDLFHQKYRGSRYSFGYPACPNLEDQAKLFALLHPEENVGVRLTTGFLLEPEQSTSAIVAHHPAAKYFVV